MDAASSYTREGMSEGSLHKGQRPRRAHVVQYVSQARLGKIEGSQRCLLLLDEKVGVVIQTAGR